MREEYSLMNFSTTPINTRTERALRMHALCTSDPRTYATADFRHVARRTRDFGGFQEAPFGG